MRWHHRQGDEVSLVNIGGHHLSNGIDLVPQFPLWHVANELAGNQSISSAVLGPALTEFRTRRKP